MLGKFNVFATVAVSDINNAKEFYGQILGLEQTDENPGGVTYQSGTGKIFVYQSPTAGKNESTSASWEVENIEDVVEELKSKGISFEQYDFPGGTREGDVHIMGGMKAAWFKDPDGNILSLGS